MQLWTSSWASAGKRDQKAETTKGNKREANRLSLDIGFLPPGHLGVILFSNGLPQKQHGQTPCLWLVGRTFKRAIHAALRLVVGDCGHLAN